MKILGVEFAPLFIPTARRLQTLAVLQWVLTFFFVGYGCLLVSIYLLFTQYWWITALYSVWLYLDRNTPYQGGRRIQWFRDRKIWKHFRDYFPIKLVKTNDLDPEKSYLFAYHPHGILCVGAFCNFATEANDFGKVFPGLSPHLITLNGQYIFPYFRDYFMTSGSCAASKESLTHILSKKGQGQVVVLIVGGAVEALEAKSGCYKLKLADRKGFVKIALQTGASLVPVYGFGETDVFSQVDNPDDSFLRAMQNYMTRMLGFSTPMFHGRGVFNYTFGVLPYRKPVTSVVGSPIHVEKCEHPTQEVIDALHSKYVKELENLFETHKGQYGIKKSDHLEFF